MFPSHGPVENFNFGEDASLHLILITSVTGIFMNGFLLFLIHRFSRKELGGYKHLLSIFAVQDILLSLIQAFCNVTPYRVGPISGVLSRTFWQSRHIPSFYCAVNALPFFITNLNFLYRFWAIKKPEMLLLYSNTFFQGAILSFAASACFTWYLQAMFICTGEVDEPATIALRESFAVKYGINITEGWIVMDHWQNNTFSFRPFFVILSNDMVMLFTLSTQATLGTMTFYYIHINTWISDYYRKSQKTVLIALCAQTFVPLFFVYIPYLNSINSPFFGIDDLIDMETLASFISAFPLLDALVIILLMKDYRKGAMNLVFESERKKNEISSRVNTSSVVMVPI